MPSVSAYSGGLTEPTDMPAPPMPNGQQLALHFFYNEVILSRCVAT
jgi:hypothetical protein